MSCSSTVPPLRAGGVGLHGRRAGKEKSQAALPRELAPVVGRPPDPRARSPGCGPRAVLVRIVGFEADVVDADAVALLEARRGPRSRRTRNCAAGPRPESARCPSTCRTSGSARRGRVGRGGRRPSRCHPPTNRCADRGTHRRAVQPVDRREHRPSKNSTPMVSDPAPDDVTSGALDDDPVCRHHGAGLGTRRGTDPTTPCSDARPRRSGSSGKVTARKPRPHVGLDLTRGDVGVEQPRHLADDPPRVATGPLVEVPVVGGAHDRQRQLGIAHAQLVALTGKPRERRREVERGVHPVQVHVVHPGIDVPRRAASRRSARARSSPPRAAAPPPLRPTL